MNQSLIKVKRIESISYVKAAKFILKKAKRTPIYKESTKKSLFHYPMAYINHINLHQTKTWSK